MKIVHFITSLEMGGAQAVLYDLVTHLNAQQWKHTIIFIHDGPYRKLFEQANIPMHQLTGFASPYDPIAFYRLIKIIKQINPDCLHTVLWSANWLGRIAAWWLGIRCINSLHNNVDQNGTVRRMLDMLTPKAQHLIAVSQEVKESYGRFHPITCPITVIPNGVDFERIHELASKNRLDRADLGYTKKNIIIGSVGRFQPVKRYPLLLETFALLQEENPEVRLLLIGSGPQEQALRNKALALGISHLVQFATDRHAHPYYPLMDLFVLSSEKEGISIALLEAMSYGIPPVITYHSSVHPVITHRVNGYVAKTAKATGFASTLVPLITNCSLRMHVGIAARTTARTSFTITAMVAAYEKIFHTQCL
jgi:glycosyltransferase involved in cell wall biosynthesis